eukprot:891008-Pelagomonas_calceolata.AAC.8
MQRRRGQLGSSVQQAHLMPSYLCTGELQHQAQLPSTIAGSPKALLLEGLPACMLAQRSSARATHVPRLVHSPRKLARGEARCHHRHHSSQHHYRKSHHHNSHPCCCLLPSSSFWRVDAPLAPAAAAAAAAADSVGAYVVQRDRHHQSLSL